LVGIPQFCHHEESSVASTVWQAINVLVFSKFMGVPH